MIVKIVKHCNDCQDLMQKVIDFNDAAIVSVKGSDCKIHI